MTQKKDYAAMALEQHRKLQGKLKTQLADSLDTKEKLSLQGHTQEIFQL